MTKRQDILISLAAPYADKIFAGEKRVELRRRPMKVSAGATVWIYVKLPVGSIVGRARIDSVHASSPTSLWRSFGSDSGLSKEEFFEYFDGVSQGSALVLEQARRLRRALSLESIREIAKGFNPPQFFMRLATEHPLLSVVPSGVAGSTRRTEKVRVN